MQAVLRIRGYDSFEQIAVGGMAVVYKARKQSLKKTVAIKVLLPHLAADTRFIMRFQQEAEAAARIQHDNIVNVVDYGQSESSYYIVMEYYDGLTIEELLRTQPRLPLDVALSIVLNVAYGLEAAHAESLVHRDIKPANVIFTRAGGIKIADFGLAKAVDKYTLVTQTGKVVGTPAYMSPEQTRGEPVGTQSDIFSLGVVAYELLTGRRPFDGSSYSEVVDRIQSCEPPPPSSFNPLIEAPCETIVSRMIAKRLDERYGRIDQVIADLEALMDRHGLRRDRRSLGEFFDDPVAYTENVNRAILDRLSGESPSAMRSDRNRNEAIRHYQKIAYLDPADEGARTSLKRLGMSEALVAELGGGEPVTEKPSAAPRPDAEYRVFLEAIDRNVETVDSFALKLSLRLKSPVPRMRSLVARAPCMVAQRLPHKKAKWLESVIVELGGSARVEEIPMDAPARAAEPNRAVGPVVTRVPSRPDPERRTSSGGIICPCCGWEDDADAKFCSLCLHRFNKTDKIDVRGFQGTDRPAENPLAADPVGEGIAARLDRLRRESPALFYGALAAIVAVGAALVFILR